MPPPIPSQEPDKEGGPQTFLPSFFDYLDHTWWGKCILYAIAGISYWYIGDNFYYHYNKDKQENHGGDATAANVHLIVGLIVVFGTWYVIHWLITKGYIQKLWRRSKVKKFFHDFVYDFENPKMADFRKKHNAWFAILRSSIDFYHVDPDEKPSSDNDVSMTGCLLESGLMLFLLYITYEFILMIFSLF